MIKTNTTYTDTDTDALNDKKPLKDFIMTGREDNFVYIPEVKALNPSFFSHEDIDAEIEFTENRILRTAYEGEVFNAIIDPKNQKPYMITGSVADKLYAVLKVRIPVVIDQDFNEWLFFMSYHNPDAVNPWGETKDEWLERGKSDWIVTPSDHHIDITPPKFNLSEPPAPSMKYEEYLREYFGGRFINRYKHPVVRRFQKHIFKNHIRKMV